MASESELAAMRQAIAMSLAAVGVSNPNPCVGACVVDATGAVIGTGVTQAVGGDHAEVGALRMAGAATRGATIVVTLEPCAHSGRTQPCVEVIQAAGIARVVFAVSDPYPAAAGGAAVLWRAGVEVEAGALADEAAAVLGPWTTAVARQRPHVTWKYAATLDGRTAAADGTSQWITGPEARRDVHRERYAADAVIAGIGTVLADDPQLTVRDWPASRQPRRVVIDSAARTPSTARVLDDAAPTTVFVDAAAPSENVAQLRSAGVDVVEVPNGAGGVDLRAVLDVLWQRDVVVAFLEGGATLATSFVSAGFVDRVVGYYAPMLLGAGTPLVGDLGIATMAAAPRFAINDVATIGGDLRVVASLTAGSE